MGKKTYYPFLNFRVDYQYRGVLPTCKTPNKEVNSEIDEKYVTTYGKSNCMLTYNDLQKLFMLVLALKANDSFKVKLDEIYFLYVFVNGQAYESYRDREWFKAYMMQLNFATHCATTTCGISSEHLNAKDNMLKSIYCFHLIFHTCKILNTLGLKLPCFDG